GVGRRLRGRLAWAGKDPARARIEPVRNHDEIGVAHGGIERRGFVLVLDLDAESAPPPAQDLEKRRARAAAEPVAADAVPRAAEMDLDIVPISEVADDRPITLLVVSLEGVERLVREPDAEAEGVVRPVALEYGDAGLWPGFLE